MRSQLVLILADPAESGALSGFFGQFHHGRAYEVLAAENRGEAVSAMSRGRPDLIGLDPQMKGLDGLQLLKQLRVTDRTVPVIIVTGTQNTQEAVEVLKVGVFAYVPSPATSRGSNISSRSRSHRGARVRVTKCPPALEAAWKGVGGEVSKTAGHRRSQ